MTREIILRELHAIEEEMERILKKWRHHFPHEAPKKKMKVLQVFIANFNLQKYIIMDPLILNNGFKAPILTALVDAATLQPIPGATKVPVSISFDTPSVATNDADGNLVAIAPGSGKLTVVNTWTYTDQNTNQTKTVDLTSVVDVQVVATPEGVLQVVTLGTAVAQ